MINNRNQSPQNRTW